MTIRFSGLARGISVSWLWALLVLCAVGTSHAQVQYIYDEVGRLTGVIAPTGDAARYTYDATGNIVSVQSSASTSVSII